MVVAAAEPGRRKPSALVAVLVALVVAAIAAGGYYYTHRVPNAANLQRLKRDTEGACTALIDVLKNKTRREYVSPYDIAVEYALMGDRDHTFEWLEQAYADRSSRLEYIKQEDFFEPFRSDPRYLDLLRRMGLPR